MDRGAWWTTVHGVTESDFTEWLNTAHMKDLLIFTWRLCRSKLFIPGRSSCCHVAMITGLLTIPATSVSSLSLYFWITSQLASFLPGSPHLLHILRVPRRKNPSLSPLPAHSFQVLFSGPPLPFLTKSPAPVVCILHPSFRKYLSFGREEVSCFHAPRLYHSMPGMPPSPHFLHFMLQDWAPVCVFSRKPFQT